MKFLISWIMTISLAGLCWGQGPKVPATIEFGGLKLKITDKARRQIQEDVDALRIHPQSFKIKLDRATMYFPIIEKIFREEKLPDDFKFLSLQESALIADAVSSSNAVGYWQFKKPTALEVGLRVDSKVDERMNISSSTRGAARYLKKNNSNFDNWIYALLSYNVGAGGAQKYVSKKNFGARKMEVNKRTHWYVKKFLAHKIAFQDETKKLKPKSYSLVEYSRGKKKSLKTIAKETSVSYEDLLYYNKWLKKGDVPHDKYYPVILPMKSRQKKKYVAMNQPPSLGARPEILKDDEKSGLYPFIKGDLKSKGKPVLIKINGLPGIIAKAGDNLGTLSTRSGTSEARIAKYNDIYMSDKIIPGQVYYVKSKKSKANLYYHTALPGESMWSISQKFGIKEKSLRQKNRMTEEESLKTGRVLWMRYIRPSNHSIEYRKDLDLLVEKNEIKAISVSKESNQLGASIQGEVQKPKQEPEISVQDGLLEETNNALIGVSATASKKAVNEHSPQSLIQIKETEKIEISSKTHIVQPGETLYAIASLYGVTVTELSEINTIDANHPIKINQEILIPLSKNTNVAPNKTQLIDDQIVMHEVQGGETLFFIATKYDVTVEKLMEWNGKKAYDLKVGERLKIQNVRR
ncbi:MAG: LysM peptidoglycan-binding domain-containing protein [Bacteroidetes bacterium]|nr:LysM peptidoglycan-binding domain-containing protein [Bacteroidota bacterium]